MALMSNYWFAWLILMVGILGVSAAPSIKDAKKACAVSIVALFLLIVGLHTVLRYV